MSIDVMKQALEALERGRSQIVGVLVQQDQDKAITALRQAIEQAERDMSIHTCSYYCDRPECIRAQRDELRQKLEQAEKQEPVAWIKEQELAYMSALAGLGMTEWKTNLGLVPEHGDVPLYTAPVHAIDMSQERVDETRKNGHD